MRSESEERPKGRQKNFSPAGSLFTAGLQRVRYDDRTPANTLTQDGPPEIIFL